MDQIDVYSIILIEHLPAFTCLRTKRKASERCLVSNEKVETVNTIYFTVFQERNTDVKRWTKCVKTNGEYVEK